MDAIIQQILDIDAKAQQKLQEAYAQRDERKKEIDVEAAKAASELQAKRECRIDKINAGEKAEAEQQIAEIRRKAAAQMAELEANFDANSSEWADEIVKAALAV